MWEHFAKPTVESVKDSIYADIRGGLAELGVKAWDWFVHIIPDIAGYGTLVAGGMIMIGSLIGEGATFKPAGYLAAGLIVSVCILEAAA